MSAKLLVVFCTLGIFTPEDCLAQLPVGTITGVVRDSSGGVVKQAQLTAVSRMTRQVRTTTTDGRGEYSFPALQPGDYNVSVNATGFQRTIRAATVEAGTTTTTDIVREPQHKAASVCRSRPVSSKTASPSAMAGRVVKVA
jgi:hypothetical protein